MGLGYLIILEAGLGFLVTVFQPSLKRILTPQVSDSRVSNLWGCLEIVEKDGEGCKALVALGVWFLALNWSLV
jgi:hypothetical protein